MICQLFQKQQQQQQQQLSLRNLNPVSPTSNATLSHGMNGSTAVIGTTNNNNIIHTSVLPGQGNMGNPIRRKITSSTHVPPNMQYHGQQQQQQQQQPSTYSHADQSVGNGSTNDYYYSSSNVANTSTGSNGTTNGMYSKSVYAQPASGLYQTQQQQQQQQQQHRSYSADSSSRMTSYQTQVRSSSTSGAYTPGQYGLRGLSTSTASSTNMNTTTTTSTATTASSSSGRYGHQPDPRAPAFIPSGFGF